MKLSLILIGLMFHLSSVQAQTKFIAEGRIDFERRINLLRQLDQPDDWFKDAIMKLPAFHSTNFSLHFDSARTVYSPAGEVPPFPFVWLLGPAKENVVYTDLAAGIKQSSKAVFEQNYLVKDSSANQWKITDEKRTIAGFECRKAVARICDSVYVVAFYTDEIAVSGGPESFGGLPGMILGLVVPRLHTTWFASKVVLAAPAANDLKMPGKGRAIPKSSLEATLKSSLSEWGKMGQRNIWWAML